MFGVEQLRKQDYRLNKMWNLSFQPPEIIQATVLTEMPAQFRLPKENDWAKINKPGQTIDSFIEGPVFDAQGNLYITDIPYGRIFKITPDLKWELVVQYFGWPNGLAIDDQGMLWVADHKLGLLKIDPRNPKAEVVLGDGSVSFLGLNDLIFDSKKNLYFTDQGQTGLHDPSGSVYCREPSGKLHQILNNVPSPNGLVFDKAERFLFVAATRSNNVWRMPIFENKTTGKVGAFQTFFGASGPDGLAMDENENLYVAHASLGGVFKLNKRGELVAYIKTPVGHTVTNLCFTPDGQSIVMTESSTGSVLIAKVM